MLDTGSADLWVIDGSCATCNKKARRFDASLSSTYRSNGTTGTLFYGSGNTTGVFSHDVITFGDLDATPHGLC
jgi:hypothetical protein